jgi:hypothetical protein
MGIEYAVLPHASMRTIIAGLTANASLRTILALLST